jgi:hypothetical protein
VRLCEVQRIKQSALRVVAFGEIDEIDEIAKRELRPSVKEGNDASLGVKHADHGARIQSQQTPQVSVGRELKLPEVGISFHDCVSLRKSGGLEGCAAGMPGPPTVTLRHATVSIVLLCHARRRLQPACFL